MLLFIRSPYFAGLLGLYCLKPIWVRIGYKVSSKAKYRPGMTWVLQLMLKSLKNSGIVANLSFFYLTGRVVWSLKYNTAMKCLKRFLLIVALNTDGPKTGSYCFEILWVFISSKPRNYITPIKADISSLSVSWISSLCVYRTLLSVALTESTSISSMGSGNEQIPTLFISVRLQGSSSDSCLT